jgi:hypothetical protein
MSRNTARANDDARPRLRWFARCWRGRRNVITDVGPVRDKDVERWLAALPPHMIAIELHEPPRPGWVWDAHRRRFVPPRAAHPRDDDAA